MLTRVAQLVDSAPFLEDSAILLGWRGADDKTVKDIAIRQNPVAEKGKSPLHMERASWPYWIVRLVMVELIGSRSELTSFVAFAGDVINISPQHPVTETFVSVVPSGTLLGHARRVWILPEE